MGCSKYKKMLTPYLDERLDGAERKLFETHLEACPHCRENYQLMRGASTALAQYGPAEPPADLAQRAVRAAMLAGQDEGREVRSGFANLVRWPAMATAALSLILALGLTLSLPAGPAGAGSEGEVMAMALVDDDGADPSLEAESVLAQEADNDDT